MEKDLYKMNCTVSAMGDKMAAPKKRTLQPMPSEKVSAMGDKMPSKIKGEMNMDKVTRVNPMGESFKK